MQGFKKLDSKLDTKNSLYLKDLQ